MDWGIVFKLGVYVVLLSPSMWLLWKLSIFIGPFS